MPTPLSLPGTGPGPADLASRPCATTSTTRSWPPRGCWETSWTWLPASGWPRWPATWTSRSSSAAFGPQKGEAIWQALKAKGWIVPRATAARRPSAAGADYGSTFFNGPLAPLCRQGRRKTRSWRSSTSRVVAVVFGDNANLSISVAKAIGSAAAPGDQGRPEDRGACGEPWNTSSTTSRRATPTCTTPRRACSASAGTPRRDQFLGWDDAQGNWHNGLHGLPGQ